MNWGCFGRKQLAIEIKVFKKWDHPIRRPKESQAKGVVCTMGEIDKSND
jgi:hypothetical protein